MHDRAEVTISHLPTGSISISVWFICLRTLKLFVKAQWKVLPILLVLDHFINKLTSEDS